jgi:hypothetical protein
VEEEIIDLKCPICNGTGIEDIDISRSCMKFPIGECCGGCTEKGECENCKGSGEIEYKLSEVTEEDGPIYEHDCKNCVFVGNLEDDKKIEYDLYYHPKQSSIDSETVVARFSDNPSDNISGMVFSKDKHSVLYYAKLLAKKKVL